MGLLRTIVGLVVLLILTHIVLVYLGVEQAANVVTQSVYGLGALLESPAPFILSALGSWLPGFMDPTGFYTVALTAAGMYFVVYVLLGVGRE
ncbi:hypothetical protein [Rubrobacter indicoceani]|uniref:hypothetical protein n=1 Tax=Rubrobacter indicoceani TaxID=2051957 RepID=UPI000E5BB10B|nr:hypothetical protein [Rubrobacter indicoceani]